MFLIGLFFCRSRIVSWETGFRIDSRAIKRGSQAGVSSASFGESSNLCIHSIIFLGCYLVLVHERIYGLWSPSQQALVHHLRISLAYLIAVFDLASFPAPHLGGYFTYIFMIFS